MRRCNLLENDQRGRVIRAMNEEEKAQGLLTVYILLTERPNNPSSKHCQQIIIFELEHCQHLTNSSSLLAT
jgi:hypothetical protein